MKKSRATRNRIACGRSGRLCEVRGSLASSEFVMCARHRRVEAKNYEITVLRSPDNDKSEGKSSVPGMVSEPEPFEVQVFESAPSLEIF